MGKNKNSKKKKKINSIFRAKGDTQLLQPWQWPSCMQQPKTLSFRAGDGDGIFRMVNSVFFDSHQRGGDGETPDSCTFTNTSGSASFSTESEDYPPGDLVEVLVRGVVRSEERRLFFEPGSGTSSILHEARAPVDVGCGGVGEDKFPFKESMALAVESENPYVDFRRSMEEMVESHGLKDWDCLEELLGWYLRVNGKANHGLIIDAFIDLLISLASNSGNDDNATTSTTATYYSSAASSFSTSPSCTLKEEESNCEIREEGLS